MISRISKRELLSQVVASVELSGWNVVIVSDQHPFDLVIYKDAAHYPLLIYIWNITHGGGAARPQNEYRIQITGVQQFEHRPGTKTLILGWWNNGVFAGFDYWKHSGVLGSSPSFQIQQSYLNEAATNGFAPCLKENQEIAVAFRPDFFVDYVVNLEHLHQFGENPSDLSLLEQMVSQPERDLKQDIESLPQERQIVMSAIQRRWRTSDFRERILRAYNHYCAFCGLQLNLVQAAHILPVVHPESTDETQNGISACYLHHAAYDRGLITFDNEYVIRVSDARIQKLQASNRDGGLGMFQDNLREIILLPPPAWRPKPALIEKANALRGWPL
jgi:putative restriction endonuclease